MPAKNLICRHFKVWWFVLGLICSPRNTQNQILNALLNSINSNHCFLFFKKMMDHSHKPRRPKSREVSSRFLSPTTAEATTLPLSPARRKPGSPISDTRKRRSQMEDPGSIRGGLWPSSTTPSIKSFDTLAQHLGNDRLKDRIDSKNSLFHTQTSPREAKENHRLILGGSTRYTGNFKFSGKSSPSSSSTSTSSNKLSGVIVPGRFSVDGNALYQNSSRRRSDTFADSLDSGSECSDAGSGTDINIGSPNFGVQSSTASSRKLGMEVSSKYMNDIHTKHRRWTSDSNLPKSISAGNSPKLNKFNLKNVIKRANSLTGSKFGTSQWALSPGRIGSAPVSAESMGKTPSFSSLKPPNSPSKTKGVEKLLHLGLDLFKSKKSSSSSRSLVRSNSGHTGVTDIGHQLRLLQNRLMQWRYANARAGIVNGNIADQAQVAVPLCKFGNIYVTECFRANMLLMIS